MDSKQKRVRFCIVVKDSKAEVMACLSSLQPFYSLSIHAECLTLWKTIELCVDLGLRNAVLEGDTLVIVKVVMQEDQDWSFLGV